MAKFTALHTIKYAKAGEGTEQTRLPNGGVVESPKIDRFVYTAGDEVDRKLFTEDEWQNLLDAGAISDDARVIDARLNPPELAPEEKPTAESDLST